MTMQMKRKRNHLGLKTEALIPEDKDRAISATAEHHLNDLRKGHARTLLAWSTAGTIVYAAPSADSLSTTNTPPDVYGSAPRLYATTLALDITTRKTHLLDPVPQPTPLENVPIDHILFSEIGMYLATADQLGSLTIWEQDVNSLQLIPRQTFPGDSGVDGTPHDVGSRIVSLRWLHNDLKLHVAVKLAKTGELWTCQSNSQRGCGPCNAVGKEGLIAITKDGRVKLIFQSPKGWRMEMLRLEGGDGEAYGGGSGVSKDLISHAAWTQDFFTGPQNNLIGLVVLRRDAALGQCVSYYRITIDFRQDLETPARLSSSLLVNRDPLDLGGDVTHLFVLPTSHTLASALGTVTVSTDEFGETKSSLTLWDITKSTTALHATFSQLSSVHNIPAPKDEAYSISLKQRCELPGIVVSTDVRIYASWIVLGYMDGSIEVRKRVSMDKPEEPVENSKNIMTPFDGGFSLSRPPNSDNRYLATLFSPNLVAHAALHASGRLEIYPMTADPTSSLISVVLAQKFTLCVKKHAILEDIYIVLEQYLNDELAMKLMQLILRFCAFRFDLSKELPMDQVISNQVWARIISIQYTMYSRLKGGAKIAGNGILLLQLRLMFMAYMMSCNPGAKGPKAQSVAKSWLGIFVSLCFADLAVKNQPLNRDAMFKEFAIVGMLGWVQWLMDYLVFVVRELLLVAKDLRQKHYDKEQDIPTMASMVFTSIVRMFLRAGIRASSELVVYAKRYVEQGVDVEPVHMHAYSMLESVTRQSPISLEFAAKFLEEIDGIMEKILSEQPNKQDIENKLFLESVVPRSLRKAIYTVTERLIGTQSPLDIPAVIFFDVTWLGLSSIQPPGAQHLDPAPNLALWDTLRKQRLLPGKVRRCNRCGVVSALNDPPVVDELVRRFNGPGQGPNRNWTAVIIRNCLCFGTWSLYELD